MISVLGCREADKFLLDSTGFSFCKTREKINTTQQHLTESEVNSVLTSTAAKSTLFRRRTQTNNRDDTDYFDDNFDCSYRIIQRKSIFRSEPI